MSPFLICLLLLSALIAVSLIILWRCCKNAVQNPEERVIDAPAPIGGWTISPECKEYDCYYYGSGQGCMTSGKCIYEPEEE